MGVNSWLGIRLSWNGGHVPPLSFKVWLGKADGCLPLVDVSKFLRERDEL